MIPIYNKTLGYFGIPCIVLFVLACLFIAFSIYKKNGRFFDIAAVSAILLFAILIVIIFIPSYDDDDISDGRVLSQCKMIEQNAYNGSFSENVNKIECNGIIKNIPVSSYNKALHAYTTRGK